MEEIRIRLNKPRAGRVIPALLDMQDEIKKSAVEWLYEGSGKYMSLLPEELENGKFFVGFSDERGNTYHQVEFDTEAEAEEFIEQVLGSRYQHVDDVPVGYYGSFFSARPYTITFHIGYRHNRLDGDVPRVVKDAVLNILDTCGFPIFTVNESSMFSVTFHKPTVYSEAREQIIAAMEKAGWTKITNDVS